MAEHRAAVVAELADRIEALRRPHPVRVAIDGIDAAGKTTLAEELASVLRRRGRRVVRVSVDSFHRPRADRYRRGELSPEGYYHDSFDYAALRETIRGAHSSQDSILLVDGVFLLRPELVEEWDLRVFVFVEPDEALRRALERDTPVFGSREEAERRYRLRYQPGQRLYFADARPLEAADVVLVNDDPTRPAIRTGRAGPAPR
jgi:uridine kinase